MTVTIQDNPLNYFDLKSYKAELNNMRYDLELLKIETQKRTVVLEKIFSKKEAKTSVFPMNYVQVAHISSFPHEIILKIFLTLDFKDAFNVVTVCKIWSAFSNDPVFVKNLIKIKRPDTFKLGIELNLNAWVFYGKIPFILDKINDDISKLREDYQKDIVKRQETIISVASSTLGLFIGTYITFPMTRKIVAFVKSLI